MFLYGNGIFYKAFNKNSPLYQLFYIGLWMLMLLIESIGINFDSEYPQVSIKNGLTFSWISLNLYSDQSTVPILVIATTIEVTPRDLARNACYLVWPSLTNPA